MTSSSESKESKFLQKAISVFLSALLVVAFIPAVAFADTSANAGYVSSQENGTYKVDASGSTVIGEDDSGAGEGANTDNSQNNGTDSANNEPNSESSGTTDSTEDSAVVQSQGDQGQSEDAMSSWRFANGQLETVYADEDNGIEMYSLRAGNGSPVAKGIDVSSWQGNIDWNTVKNSGQVDFVIIRCGWGNNDSSQNDAYWLRNASECKRLGIPFGVYIYSYACNTSYAVSEADHVLAQLNAAGLSPSQVAYPIYLDLEQQSKSNNRPCGIDNWNNEVLLSNGDLANIAQAFCNRIASAGYTPGIYANLNWWNNYLTSSVFDNYERWVAQYNSSCWYEGNYSLWQYASDGTVPGISGYVDMNYAYIDTSKSPAASVASTGDGTVTLKWDAVEGAAKYAIAEYVDGSYKNFDTNFKGTTYTISNLANEYQHTFLVQAYINGKWSAFSAANYVKATPHGTVKPTAKVTATSSSSVTLNWNSVPGASRYAVAIKTGNDSYRNYTTTYTGTSYTISGLSESTSYEILVQANINGRWSAFSNADLVKTTTDRDKTRPAASVASTGDGTVTLKWDAVEGAAKYAIAEYVDGSYKNFDTNFKGTTYTISNLANEYQHTFLVQAYINGKWSAFSAANYVKATPHGTVKPTAKVTATSSSSVTLNWNSVPGASRYAVAIKTGNDSYRNYTTTYTGTSYTISGLSESTSYEILVQANINGRWSAFSNADLVKTTTGK